MSSMEISETDRLQAKVNFNRKDSASRSQYMCASLIWVGIGATILAFVWSASARNVWYRPGSACIPCAEGWHPVIFAKGRELCPKKCISNGLKVAKDECKAAASVQVRALSAGSEPAHRRLSGETVGPKTMLQMLGSPALGTFYPVILVVAAVWFWVLHHAAHCAVWSTAVIFAISMCYGMYLTHNWVMVLIAAAYVGFLGMKRKQVNLGCSCLQEGLTALSESRFSLIVIVFTSLLQLIYTFLLVSTFVYSNNIVTLNKQCKEVAVSEEYLTYSVFLFLMLLTSCFFTMVVVFAISYAIAIWYFHKGDSSSDMPATPMVTGLQMALLTPNGTGACAQAGVVMSLVDYVEKQQSNPCNVCNPAYCFVMCVFTVFRQFLESLCSFAVVAVSVHGGSFTRTAKKAKQTLGTERAGRFLAIDASMTWVLRLQANTLSTVIGILALMAIDADEDLGIFTSFREQTSKLDDAWFTQWVVVLSVFVFYFLLQRPLITFSATILFYIMVAKSWEKTMVNAIGAALIVGSIGSIIFHQFAEAAKGALDALVYCYSLDEASGFQSLGSSSPQCKQIADLSQKMMDLQALYQPNAQPLAGQTDQVARPAAAV